MVGLAQGLSLAMLDALFGHESEKGIYLSSKKFDFVLFFVGVLLPIVFFVLYWNAGIPMASLMVLFIVLLDTPHAMQTITRVWMDDQARTLFGRRAILCFVVMAIVCLTLIFTGNSFYILIILLFYGPYHIIMQHFGMASLYRAKAGSTSVQVAMQDKHLLLSTYCLCVSWASHDLFNLGPLWLWPEFVQPFEALGLALVPLMLSDFWLSFVLPASFVYFVVSLARWLLGLYQELGRGMGLNRPRLLTLCLAVLNFLVVFFVLNAVAVSLNEGLFFVVIGITAWHAVQYNGLVWHYNNKKFCALKGIGGAGSALLAWLSQRHRFFYYIGFLALITLCTQLIAMLLLWLDSHAVKAWLGDTHGLVYAAYSVTFTHYYLDTLIWKGKHNKELGQVMFG
ncbi:hypothetical protein [Marinagarivorans cellulosilyticus]|uniref:Uncharacterized protein n=1 Tax=Marinagarivorans cellulosilyticus TaxID=2721545 RepID=A0AAN1WL22_9GAMM|nr:hypothetical protein [Marinagarivorans cellulosilyticus]BCD99562.1 hypothetical protein MARGE09_P3764 [Marinagarivorans cellulosilyticus]